MFSFSDNIDQIIINAINQYAKKGKFDEPHAMRILIQAPKFLGVTVLPPILMDVAMVNSEDQTVAVLLGEYTWHIPEDDIGSVLSKLLSMDQLLKEQNEEDDTEDDNNEQQKQEKDNLES